MGSVAAALTPLDLVTRVRPEALPIAVVCVSLAWYLWCLRRLAARGQSWPAARTAAWCVGELSYVVATMSGLASYDKASFAIPAAGHILSGMLAPVLFALAAPLTLATESSGTRVRQVMTQALHSRPARVVANPIATWALYAASLFTFYFTGLYRFGVHHPLFGQAAQLELLVAGCLWIWPAAGVDPVPGRLGYFGRILYLILSMPVHTIFGMGLESQGKTLVAGIPVSSVHLGGGLIWVAGEALGLLGAIAVFVGWLRSDERWAKRADRYTEVSADRQLARWRAAREAAARAVITLDDLCAARKRLEGVVRRTPVERSETLSSLAGRDVLLKPEQRQRTGSFKIRGAYNRIAQLPEGVAVIAASAGNHGQGVALAASLTGHRATIFMPRGAALPKVAATRGYGAEVRLEGETVDDCILLAESLAHRTGAVYVAPFDDDDVIAGQGSIGLEILEEAPEAEVVVVPAGGGGLLAGVAVAVALGARAGGRETAPLVVGVEAAGAPTLTKALDAGHPVRLERLMTMADGIAVASCSELTLSYPRAFVHSVVLVDEEEISRALLLLVERAKTVVEPAGAASLAALLAARVPGTGPAVAVLSGGNVDPLLLTKLLEHGLAAAGRYLTVRVVVADRVGALASLASELARLGLNVLDVEHHRSGRELGVAEVEVQVTVETRDVEHHAEVLNALATAGYRVEPAG